MLRSNIVVLNRMNLNLVLSFIYKEGINEYFSFK